jgi:hypothetical protein
LLVFLTMASVHIGCCRSLMQPLLLNNTHCN